MACRHHGSVLVDANVIIEAHRARTWLALAGGYQIETVEEVVWETQTRFQRRRQEQQIDQSGLRISLAEIHETSNCDQLKLTAVQHFALIYLLADKYHRDSRSSQTSKSTYVRLGKD